MKAVSITPPGALIDSGFYACRIDWGLGTGAFETPIQPDKKGDEKGASQDTLRGLIPPRHKPLSDKGLRVGGTELESVTSTMSTLRSNQLS